MEDKELEDVVVVLKSCKSTKGTLMRTFAACTTAPTTVATIVTTTAIAIAVCIFMEHTVQKQKTIP